MTSGGVHPVTEVERGWHVYFNDAWHLVGETSRSSSHEVILLFADLAVPAIIDDHLGVQAKKPTEWLSHLDAEIREIRRLAGSRT